MHARDHAGLLQIMLEHNISVQIYLESWRSDLDERGMLLRTKSVPSKISTFNVESLAVIGSLMKVTLRMLPPPLK